MISYDNDLSDFGCDDNGLTPHVMELLQIITQSGSELQMKVEPVYCTKHWTLLAALFRSDIPP